MNVLKDEDQGALVRQSLEESAQGGQVLCLQGLGVEQTHPLLGLAFQVQGEQVTQVGIHLERRIAKQIVDERLQGGSRFLFTGSGG